MKSLRSTLTRVRNTTLAIVRDLARKNRRPITEELDGLLLLGIEADKKRK